jgi:hypothetical protein
MNIDHGQNNRKSKEAHQVPRGRVGNQEDEKLKHGSVSLDLDTVDPADHFGKPSGPAKKIISQTQNKGAPRIPRGTFIQER